MFRKRFTLATLIVLVITTCWACSGIPSPKRAYQRSTDSVIPSPQKVYQKSTDSVIPSPQKAYQKSTERLILFYKGEPKPPNEDSVLVVRPPVYPIAVDGKIIDNNKFHNSRPLVLHLLPGHHAVRLAFGVETTPEIRYSVTPTTVQFTSKPGHVYIVRYHAPSNDVFTLKSWQPFIQDKTTIFSNLHRTGASQEGGMGRHLSKHDAGVVLRMVFRQTLLSDGLLSSVESVDDKGITYLNFPGDFIRNYSHTLMETPLQGAESARISFSQVTWFQVSQHSSGGNLHIVELHSGKEKNWSWYFSLTTEQADALREALHILCPSAEIGKKL